MKKVTSVFLTLCLMMTMVTPVFATEIGDELVDSDQQARIMSEPIEAPAADEESYVVDDSYAIDDSSEGNAYEPVLDGAPTGYASAFISMPTTFDSTATSKYSGWYWKFYAQQAEFDGFWDDKGYYNVAYRESTSDNCTILINRYDANLKLIKTVRITPDLPLFGAVIGDGDYYYVVTGKEDTNQEDIEVLSTAKYDYNGTYISRCTIKGYDCQPDYYYDVPRFATKIPFDAGSCKLAIQNGVLVCNHAREMYSGHQSNFVYYVDTSTMERIDAVSPYCSHSFDQDVIATSDGGYLFANHGDASKRGFNITKVNASKRISGDDITFHFREGAERSSGYNETFAQLGGIVETSSSYVLCGASEKTLSLKPGPTKTYCGHNESRDLFVQVLKKDFYSYSGSNRYKVSGVTRTAVDERPETSLTSMYLKEGTTDYGVIWLTDYDDAYYVNNPKVVYDGSGHIVILWEKCSYSSASSAIGTTYYAVYDENMNELIAPTALKDGTYLPGNSDVTCHDGVLYWPTCDNAGSFIRRLNISDMIPNAQVDYYQVALDGTIVLKYYMTFGDGMTNDDIVVKAADGTRVNLLLDATYKPEDIKVGDKYVISIPVPAKYMSDTITLNLFQNNKLQFSNQYSLKQYADYILSNTSNSSEYAAAEKLVKAMLNYGGYAQEYFGYNQDKLANDGIYTGINPVLAGDVPDSRFSTPTITDNCDDLDFMGASLVCESTTALKLYFKTKNAMNASEFDSKYSYYTMTTSTITREVTFENGYLVVTFANIAANNLGNECGITFTSKSNIKDNISVMYSPMAYISKAQKGSNDELKNLVRAIYYYNQEAVDYNG